MNLNDDMKTALIIGLVGFVIMIAASIALWFFQLSEIGCSIVMAIGVIIVVIAMVYASFPQYFGFINGKSKEQPAPESSEEPTHDDDTQTVEGDIIDDKPKE